MLPVLYIGSVAIPLYGTIIALAYAIGIFLMSRRAGIYACPKKHIYILSVTCAAGTIAGAKLFYFFTVLPDYIDNCKYVMSDPCSALYYGFSGYVFYGGLFGAFFMILLYCVRHEISFLKITNIIIPVVPFIHACGRIGCFFGGCCYGISYSGPLSVKFPDESLIYNLGSCRRFPVQLLEAFALFALFIIMYLNSAKIFPHGFMLKAYLGSYSIIRFMTEFLRGDTYRGIFMYLSFSQWLSLFILICVILSVYLPHKKSS